MEGRRDDAVWKGGGVMQCGREGVMQCGKKE